MVSVGGAADLQNGGSAHGRRPTLGWLDDSGISVTTVNLPWCLALWGVVATPDSNLMGPLASSAATSRPPPDPVQAKARTTSKSVPSRRMWLTNRGQFVADGLDGDHAVALGPLVLAVAVHLGVVAHREVGRLQAGPAEILVTNLGVAAALALASGSRSLPTQR